ncbi:protein yipf [Anaeramoeba ignava]|uniref:Protein YIPF n=1 Tax=Anaeramoeba ignava TaxID=1746090 RepID=A0A9Q0LJH5_ANAIG|nr:protein yipf [Anaeramoeba ignava]
MSDTDENQNGLKNTHVESESENENKGGGLFDADLLLTSDAELSSNKDLEEEKQEKQEKQEETVKPKEENNDLEFQSFGNKNDQSLEFKPEQLNSKQRKVPELHPPLWSIDYYKEFFNIETKEVFKKMGLSIIPFSTKFYSRKADLYGPFWITTTLVFLMSVSGNLASYMDSRKSGSENWQYDFTKVTFACTLLYGYVFLLPFIIYMISKCFISEKFEMTKLMGSIGYSLSFYIPVSILCVIPNESLRWSLVLIVGIATLVNIIINLYQELKNDGKMNRVLVILLLILLTHLTVVFLLKFIFFQYKEVKN